MVLVQQGDREAYGLLFARYRAPIWSFLVRRTGDREASSDLFQDVFLRVWRFAGTYRREQRFRPWVYRVAANACRDRFRSSQRDVDVIDDVDLDRTVTRGTLGDDPITGLDLERALGGLPDNLREAFLLGVVHGLDHNEVADALDISPANARARISRARVALRELLAGRAPEEV